MAVVVPDAYNRQIGCAELVPQLLPQLSDNAVDLDVGVADANNAQFGGSKPRSFEHRADRFEWQLRRSRVPLSVESFFSDVGYELTIADECCTPIVPNVHA